MGHWNYRVCRKAIRSEHREDPIYFYGIYEVFYNDDGSIWAVTENPVGIGVDRFTEEESETEQWAIEEIRGALDKMLRATTKDILDLDTVVFVDDRPYVVEESENSHDSQD